MSIFPVQKDNVETTDNASDYQVTLADMDIVDNIPGNYGRIVHDTEDDYTYGDELNLSYNLI